MSLDSQCECKRKPERMYRMQPCEELNSHFQCKPTASPRSQQCLSNPSLLVVTAKPWRQQHHLCWTFSLLTVSTVTHRWFKNLPFQASAHRVCLVFPLFFCWGRQESSFPSCLIQQLRNNPTFTNNWGTVHCFGLWSVFYKDILEKRTPNLWGKWIRPWENGSKQHSLLPSKFRLNAHELLNYHIGEKPWGRITELTVRLLLQTLGFHGNRK